MSNKLYRIRNRNQKIEGPNSEAEVLAGIRSGRFNGDDGICQEGSFGPWVKLSSHPKFYDEFLRKLFEAKYEVSQYTDPSQTKTPVRPPDSAQTLSVDQAHVGVEKVLTEIPSGGAESPPDEVARRAGLTIHQSEIDLLFSKSKRIKETTVAALSPQAVVPGADLLPAAGQESAAPKRTIQLRRVGLLAVIVLTALYFLGSPSKHPRISSENLGDQVSQNKTFESQSAEINRYATLLLEADELARQDIPIFLASAEEHLRAAIAFDEKTVDAFVKLALVLTRQYHYASADRRPEIGERLKEILRRGREIEPQKEVFYVAEGEHALTDGDIALAKQSLSYAHETNPQSFVVEQLAIAVELAEGASEGLLERMKKLAPPAPFRSRVSYWLAATERRLGKLAEARKTLLEALQENPVHAPSYLLLGEVFSAQNDLGDARNAFETAGRLARLDGFRSAAGAYLRLGDVEQSLGKAESAIRSYRLARYFGASDVEVKKRSPSFSYDRKSVLAEAGKEPYEARYFADQARVLFSERNYPAAVLFYRVAAHLDGKTTEYQVKLGEATELMATTVGQFLRARFLYLKALEAAPESVGALVHLGSLETDFYRFDQGYEALRQAAALRPEAVEPMIALGKHFFRRQDYQASLEQFLRAKKIAPLDPEVPYYAGLLILKFSKEQAREAMALFYRSYTLDPQNYAALAEWLKLKVTYYEKNFAIKFVNALIQQNPNNANYLWALGQIYEANGEANRAIRYYHQALDIDNRNGKVRMSLAKVLRTVGETEAAIEEYRLSSRLDIRNGDGYFQASELELELKNYTGARRDIDALLTHLPDYPGAFRQLSKLAYLTGEKGSAVASMRKEVDRNPLNTKYRQELAELFYEYNKLDDAINELSQITNLPNRTKAPEYTKDKVRAFLWLSRCHRAASRFESAEGAVKLALDLDPNDPDLIREKGFVLQGERRDKEAAATLDEYLKRSPAATDAEQIKKIIQQLVIEE